MKHFITLTLFLLLSLHLLSQKDIIYWTDTSSSYIDHRIINLIEDKSSIFALSKSMDANFQNLHPSFSRISAEGKLQNFTVYKDVSDIYALNSLVMQPDGDIRIYGTATSNNRFIPYVNSVTPAGVMARTSFMMVNVPHYVGEARQINANECVWSKSIQGSATHKYNAFVYRVDMSKNDNMIWKAILTSEFDEECSRLFVQSDTSILLLCKRYTDETFLSWVPVIYKIDAKGTLLWNKELSDYSDFTEQNIAADKNNIYYTNANGNEKSGTSTGNLIKLDQKGEVLNRIAIEDMNPNGIVALKSGKLLLYGGVYKPDGIQFIKKGKVYLFDDKLTKIKERSMGEMDKPDYELPGMGISMKPTSSDFLTAIQLIDGRVAIGGRVYMPLHTANTMEVISSARANRNLLILAGEDGIW